MEIEHYEVALKLIDALDGIPVSEEEWDARMTQLFLELSIPIGFLGDPERQRWHTRQPVRVEEPPDYVLPRENWHTAVVELMKDAPQGARIRMPTVDACHLASHLAAKWQRGDLVFEVGSEVT